MIFFGFGVCRNLHFLLVNIAFKNPVCANLLTFSMSSVKSSAQLDIFSKCMYVLPYLKIGQIMVKSSHNIDSFFLNLLLVFRTKATISQFRKL